MVVSGCGRLWCYTEVMGDGVSESHFKSLTLPFNTAGLAEFVFGTAAALIGEIQSDVVPCLLDIDASE